MAKNKDSMPVMEDDWRAGDDARTLQRAQEIEADGKRKKAAQNFAKKEIDKLSKVAGTAKKATKPAARSKKK